MSAPDPALSPHDTDTTGETVLANRWAHRAADASIVDPVRLRVQGVSVAAYRDNRWPLEVLGNTCTDAIVFEQQRRRKAESMGWRDVELAWREPLKRLAWLMINKPVPDHLLLLPGSNYTARPGAGTILYTIHGVITFLRWLRETTTDTEVTVTEIRHVNDYHLQRWVKYVHARNLNDPSVYIRPLTYLWAWGEAGELPTSDVLIRPFWIGQETAVLRPGRNAGEGREPLARETMDPLIWWAVEFVERFAGDCLAALGWYHDNRARIDTRSTIGHDPDAALSWLRSLPEHPAVDDGRPVRDMAYLTAISPGLPGRSIWTGLNRLRKTAGATLPPLAPPGTAKPLPISGTALINGQPWLTLDWRHVTDRHGRLRASLLWSTLLGACAVVIGYLGAGPRPLELRSLRRGCLTVQYPGNGAIRYRIDGRIRKKQRDATDQQSLDGVEHVWPVLPQAARAVEVLDHLPNPSRSDLLFCDPDGRPLDASGVNKAIGVFIDLANQIATDHRLPLIAEDPSGVTAGRLRRTIGPFIRNRPDGVFGLAVVYGHASSIIGASYGGMKQSGSTRYLPQETADHIAATLNTINSSLDHDGGLSGPAAQEAINAATTFRGAILTSRDWKKILTNPDIQTYDNPDSAIGCRFDPTTRPPCQNNTAQDARTEPDLSNCHPSCANRFYTDQHAHEHERKAAELDTWADLAPEPEAVRLRRKADEHRATAERHWQTRIGTDGTAVPTHPDHPHRGE